MKYWFEEQQRLFQLGHRQLCLLKGTKPWALKLIEQQQAATSIDSTRVAIFNDEHLTQAKGWQLINQKNYRLHLGQELAQFIFVGSDIEPDVFAAMAGTVEAGGYIFIIIEPDFPLVNTPYQQRFFTQVFNNKSVRIIEEKQESTTFNDVISNHTHSKITSYSPSIVHKYHCINAQQAVCVDAILNVVHGHRNRPLILTADRGRGKSAALGLACVELLKNNNVPMSIILTAPKISALDSCWQMLHDYFPKLIRDGNKAFVEQSSIEFIPIDALLKNKPKTNLLIVDEAASFPLYLLSSLFDHYHRLVFSSTLHGYEGAGRGFAIKFSDILSQKKQQANYLTLSEPIRWRSDDPVEALVFETCLLNAELPLFDDKAIIKVAKEELMQELSYQQLQPNELIINESLLRDIFAILVTAHYQTSPSDLKLLLNNKAISIFAAFLQNKPIAVALIIEEGQLTQNEVASIKQGHRRVKNHFTPQVLMNHCGYDDAFDYRYWRIMRIAVHPSFQQKSVGTEFLSQIEIQAKAKNIDMLSSSFAINEKLFDFWVKQAWKMARLGFQPDHASGEYSALLLKSIHPNSKAFVSKVEENYYCSFLFLLSNHFTRLNTALVQKILHKTPKSVLPEFSAFDRKTVDDFKQEIRLLDNCAYSLAIWLQRQLAIKNHEQLLPLTAYLFQKKTVKEICEQFSLPGKKALYKKLINIVSNLN